MDTVGTNKLLNPLNAMIYDNFVVDLDPAHSEVGLMKKKTKKKQGKDRQMSVTLTQ